MNITEYLVLWRNYPESEATWEPLEHLHNAQECIDEYERAQRVLEEQDA